MQVPLHIVFRGMEPSEAVEARVRERASSLDRLSDRITSCHVVIDAPHKRHHQGNLYQIRVQLSLPGQKELIVNHEGPQDHAHEDPYVAVRDAFNAVERQLEDVVRQQDHRR